MKIATWNVNFLKARLPHLEQWLARMRPDILGLQETNREDDTFPDGDLAALGYHSVFNIAPDARDVHDPALWCDDSILTSKAERAALAELLEP